METLIEKVNMQNDGNWNFWKILVQQKIFSPIKVTLNFSQRLILFISSFFYFIFLKYIFDKLIAMKTLKEYTLEENGYWNEIYRQRRVNRVYLDTF